MFFLTISIFCFTFLPILVEIQSADKQPNFSDYDLAGTEWAIRNTVKNIFSTLKLKDVNQKLKLEQYSTIHSFFNSMTLQDRDNLKEIARLTKVESLDNSTRVFIAQLNEVLNEDYKSDEETDAVYVTNFIEEFLENLDTLKEMYGLNNHSTNFNVNKDIIQHFDNNEDECENETISTNGNNSIENILGESEYWQPSGRRIYGGESVKIDRYPFMASVKLFKKFQCGGSIIKSDLVITSASCLQLAWNNRLFRENPAFLSVQVGSSRSEGGGGDDISVLEIYFHPSYNPKNLKHNLAIMRLMRALKFGRKVRQIKKIKIDRNPWALPSNTDGITIIGWGAKSSANVIDISIKNKLSYAVLDFYPLIECQEIYSKEYVTHTNFCAGFMSKGGGACNRDVGGPGVVHGVLVGVVSFGSPICGAPDAPTVFTKLGFYAEWIEKIMELNVPQHPAQTTLRPTIQAPPHMWEATTFKIKPIDSYDKIAPKLIPIKDADILRMKDKAMFEEFMEKMFDSYELQEFIDEIDAEKRNTKTKLEKKVQDQIQSLKKNKYNSQTTSMTNNKSKIKKISHKHNTATHTHHVKISKSKMEYGSHSTTPIERVTVAFGHRKVIKQNKGIENDKKLEKVLESLIDNLNLDEISEFEYSSLEPIQNERSKDKRKVHKSDKTINNQVPTRQKTNRVDNLYTYLFERAKNIINKDNKAVVNSKESEDVDSSNSKKNENTEKNKEDYDSKATESYEELGQTSDENANENDDGETGDNTNEKDEHENGGNEDAEEDATKSYETEYNENDNDDDNIESDESTKGLDSTSGENQSSRNNGNKKDHINKDKNAIKQSKNDDFEPSRMQNRKFKKSLARRNKTEELFRILANLKF